jgi:hypothetical protein
MIMELATRAKQGKQGCGRNAMLHLQTAPLAAP